MLGEHSVTLHSSNKLGAPLCFFRSTQNKFISPLINKDLEAQDLTDKSKGWTQVWGLGLLDSKLLSPTHVTHSRCLRIVTCLIIPSSLFRNSGIPAEPSPGGFVMEVLPLLLPRGTPGTASLTHLQAQKQPEPCTMQSSRKRKFAPSRSSLGFYFICSSVCVFFPARQVSVRNHKW